MEKRQFLLDLSKLTEGERIEMKKLGILSEADNFTEPVYPSIHDKRPPIEKHVVHVPHILNEAYDYQKPSPFQGLCLDLGVRFADLRNGKCK
jgi:hypothetical protein